MEFVVCLSASVARHLYIRSPCGVKGLVKIYGGRQNNGTCPSHFCGGSSSVARKALQALEHVKIVEKDPNGYCLSTAYFCLCYIGQMRSCAPCRPRSIVVSKEVRIFLVGAVNKVHTAPWPHCPNRNVFNDRRNSWYDKSASFRCDGRLFHSLGPAAENALSPKVRMSTSRRMFGSL